MRRFVVLILIASILVLPVFAIPDDYSIYDDTSWADIPAQEPPYGGMIDAIIEALPNLSDGVPGDAMDYVGYEIMPLYTLDSGTTPVDSGLRSVMRDLIGPYSPVVVQYQYTNGTNTQYLREILPDYEWMFNFGLFALVLFCVFKMGGALLCRR